MYSNTAVCSSSRSGQVRRFTSSFLSVAKNVSATAVVRVAAGAHRDGNAGLASGPAERQRDELGGFNRSSQRSIQRSCGEQTEAEVGSGWSACDALARASDGGSAGAPAGVLGGDRERACERGRCGGGGRVGRGRRPVVPGGWRDALSQSRPAVQRPDGVAVDGPEVVWIGRRRGRRKDRRWARSWSPEQISARLRLDFPDAESMRVSHEAIYQSLYVQGRGALRRDLTACLRTRRALRVPRARTRGKSFVTDQLLISERPAEAEDRAVPGHWEGDLILGLGSSAIGTLVERTTRFTMLLHLPPMPGHDGPRVKNGPALTGHGAEAVRDAIAEAITTLPEQLRRSLTWDQGAEMAHHAQLRIQTGLPVYFCDPHSPWQRATNENTNGLLRQYFPRGTDLARHSAADLAAVAATLNSRPRKTLDWRTPAEALDEHLGMIA
jgi:IS30 family transposase